MITHEDWETSVKFHGHICPGIAVGHRACWYARKLLNLSSPSLASEYVVVAENDLCGVDAVQINTGCTVGNDGLIIDLQGKQAFSFIQKKTGKGVRIVLEAPLWDSNNPIELHHKVKLGTASPEEAQEFFRLRKQRGEELLKLTDEELFNTDFIEQKIPGKPRLHPVVRCSRCDEQVMLPWAEKHGEQTLCPSCRKQ